MIGNTAFHLMLGDDVEVTNYGAMHVEVHFKSADGTNDQRFVITNTQANYLAEEIASRIDEMADRLAGL